jgi:hypothetical protein
MYKEYEEFAYLRQKFLIDPGPRYPIQTTYSCKIENLPTNVQTESLFRDFFNKIFPNEVHSVSIPQNMKQVEKLLAEREKVIAKYESSMAIDEALEHQKPPMVKINSKNKTVMCGGEKVTALVCYHSEIVRLTE